mmetsp:Transcript_874/g.1243  ORF Transcript_874/g.1243 Transcript_874/m.1243 type:complete len:656 (+) Transcript_874:111-2078(+)
MPAYLMENLPPPPPVLPPSQAPQPSLAIDYGKADSELVETVTSACSVLEELRCLKAEEEASLVFMSSLLRHPPGVGGTVDASSLPGALQDAWEALSSASSSPAVAQTQKSFLEASKDDPANFPLGRGQVGRVLHTAALSVCCNRAKDLSKQLHSKRQKEDSIVQVLRKAKTTQASSESLLAVFDEKLQQLRQYHARHAVESKSSTRSAKRQKTGHPLADGYDLSSLVSTELAKYTQEALFTTEEVLGKYFDLQALHQETIDFSWTNKSIFPENLTDFLHLLSKGLANSISEKDKLHDRKKYRRFLSSMQAYLESFLKRSMPLLAVESVIEQSLEDFKKEWGETGGVTGWEAKASEANWVQDNIQNVSSGTANSIDLSKYASAEVLAKEVNGDVLKTELSKLGLKCGGTPLDRAKRIYLTKDTPLDKLPKKVFAKSNSSSKTKSEGVTTSEERRVDLARQEVIVTALLNQLRPTLDATIRRSERRQTQTEKEREQELEEELHGSELAETDRKKKDEGNGSDDSDEDDEDAPIYNPKGVPLGWDGKPIPYWLFKLHGLNHFYPCEVCGNESYRGRRNFEKHFAEAKHAYGMKCLGIPNTKHFHGVTKIEDAQELWEKLQNSMEKDNFDGGKDEEYEDSHGNVLSRTDYEDLARQGLL